MNRFFSALIALTFVACGHENGEPLARYDVAGEDQRWSVALLATDGEAAARQYTLEVAGRVFDLDIEAQADSTLYTVVEAGEALLTVETSDTFESTTMGPDGQLFLTSGVDRAVMYGEMEKVVDATALMLTSEPFIAKLTAPEQAYGTVEQALIRMSNDGCCPNFCKGSDREDPNRGSCCCGVGERCVPTPNSCYCEPATKPTSIAATSYVTR